MGWLELTGQVPASEAVLPVTSSRGQPWGHGLRRLFHLPLLLLLLCCPRLGPSAAEAEVLYDTPWAQCAMPPAVLQERVGAGTESVFSLCLKTNSGFKVTFDNADSFYIGNSSSFLDLTAACYNIAQVLRVQQEPDGTYNFLPGSLPQGLAEQAWDLSLWPKYDASAKQKVNITVVNEGPSDIRFTGIDFSALGLPRDFTIAQGTTTTFAVDYSKVTLKYDTLPVLQDYILNNNNSPIRPNVVTGFVMIQTIVGASGDVSYLIAYALVLYQPGDPVNEWQFFLHESTFQPSTTGASSGAGGRKLLVVSAKNLSPPAACSKGCCKPAAPLPKTCTPKSKTYPACLKKCGCACK